MDKAIEKAVSKSRERDFAGEEERPKKKPRREHKESRRPSTEDEAAIAKKSFVAKPSIDPKNFLIAKKELRNLSLRYKDINVEEIEKIQKGIESLQPDEVFNALENMKIAIGVQSPDHTAKAMVGTIGLVLQRVLKEPSIYSRLMSDDRLLAIMEYMIPVMSDYLTIPLQIVHSIAGHVSEVQFPSKAKVPEIIQ
jgi:hypothetical protein